MKVSALILDARAQPRAVLNWTLIGEYADEIRAGTQFDPIVAFGTEERAYVGDGWHRTHAHIQAEVDEIAVDLRPGDVAEAIWHSVGANKTHGLRRSNEDKRRAVMTALTTRPELSDRAIADHCGVAGVTVGRIRSELAMTATLLQSSERVGADGRLINTTNIGRREFIESPWRGERCETCQQWHLPVSFCPNPVPVSEPITDIDGNTYRTLSLADATITEDDVIEASGGDEDGRVRIARIRAAYSAGVRATLELIALNPESVAGVLAPHQLVVARSFTRDVRAWCDRLDSSLDRGIRLVGVEESRG